MARFIIRALIGAVGLWIASKLIHGIRYDSYVSLLIAAVVLGIANAIVRPVLVILTLPFTILTLGLFLLVINGLMLELAAVFVHGFHVHGLVAAVLGSIVVGVTSWIGHAVLGSMD
jgi:putative membrane protein